MFVLLLKRYAIPIIMIFAIGTFSYFQDKANKQTISELQTKRNELTSSIAALNSKIAFQNTLISSANEQSQLAKLEFDAKMQELIEEQKNKEVEYKHKWSLENFANHKCEDNVKTLNSNTDNLIAKWRQ